MTLRDAVALSVLLFAPAPLAAGTLDEGKLDPAWFGGAPEFRETDEIDYLWVAPGFSLDGKKVRFVEWPEPEFLGPKAAERDAGDQRLARQMNATMHELFRDGFAAAFRDRIQVVDSGEDLRVEGRIVDCSTGAVAAKVLVGFGAGSGSTTVDVRFVDAATGETRMALHHRSVSGTTWSTTDSKFVGWVDDVTEEGAKKGFEKLWAKGDRVRK